MLFWGTCWKGCCCCSWEDSLNILKVYHKILLKLSCLTWGLITNQSCDCSCYSSCWTHFPWIIGQKNISLRSCILRIWTLKCEDFVYFNMFHVSFSLLLATHCFSLSFSICFPRLQLPETSALASHSFNLFLFPLLLHFVNPQGTVGKA